jgi:hypothetical protein
VCTILKVHYDDNTAILYDRSKLEPLSKAVKSQDRWSLFLEHQVFEDIHSTMERCSLR